MNKRKARTEIKNKLKDMGIDIRRELTDEEISLNTPEGRKNFLKGKKITFACCFCENGIEDPAKETAIMIGHSKQTYWCHKKCLKSKMTEWAKSEFQE